MGITTQDRKKTHKKKADEFPHLFANAVPKDKTVREDGPILTLTGETAADSKHSLGTGVVSEGKRKRERACKHIFSSHPSRTFVSPVEFASFS
jgi:hypothetical protein